MWGWYDGPRSGIADFQGKPHLYESLWDPKTHGSDWTDLFLLMPLEAETFELAMEDWHIWLRWDEAFHAGRATQETRGALPEDRKRSEELDALLAGRLEMQPQRAFLKRGFFDKPVKTVQWLSTEETGAGLLTYSGLTMDDDSVGGLSFPKS